MMELGFLFCEPSLHFLKWIFEITFFSIVNQFGMKVWKLVILWKGLKKELRPDSVHFDTVQS